MPTPEDQQPRPTTLAEIRDLGMIPLWSKEKPNWAGLAGVSKWTAYAAARSKQVKTTRAGRQIVVPVPPLRRQLGDLPPLKDAEVVE